MRNMRRYVLVLLIAISVVLVGCSDETPAKQPLASRGILDLSYWKLEQSILRLNGQWEFYWNQFDTENFNGYINVPSAWNGHEVDGRNLPGNGYATYKLTIRTKSSHRMALYIPRVFTSYNIFFNEKIIASAGEVASNKENSSPQFLPQVVFLDVQEGDNEIIIQVSNFHHRSGGILESLLFGDEKSILDYRYSRIAQDLFLFGALFIIGIYHLALSIYRKKEKAPLYFGVFCLLVAIRTLLVGERFFSHIFPNFNWETAYKIQTLTFYLGVPIILMYFKFIFKKDVPSAFVRIVQAISAAFAIIVVLTPVRTYSILNPLFQIFCFISIAILLFIFIRLVFRRNRTSIAIIFGGLALIFASVNDMIFLSVWFNDSAPIFLRRIITTGNLFAVGQLIFVFSNSLVMVKGCREQ